MQDTYLTLSSKIGQGTYTERRSKFLAFAHHVEDTEQIKKIITQYQKKYYDARHVCYAYMLGAERNIFRANDNGEPSSTAGKPILGQINSNNITDALIVVVRYFGGTKLGTPGLITAYRTAAATAIEDAEIIEKTIDEDIYLEFDFNHMNNVMHIVKDMNATIVNQDYDTNCTATLRIRKSLAPQLKAKAKDYLKITQ